MRKCYQVEWHGIRFDSFTEMSASNIADASFYAGFYRAFFEKYQNWDELEGRWVVDKLSLAGFLMVNAHIHKKMNILSIGCGLGIIEKKLIEEGYSSVEITEVSQEPMRWIEQYLSNLRIHVGPFPDCLPDGRRFDFIYLSGVDYCFESEDFARLLKSVHARLLPGGQCLLFSASFDFRMGPGQILLRRTKGLAKLVLEKLGLRKRGQFWGYIRTESEFRKTMQESGFTQLRDGLVDYTLRDNYWIQGTKA